MKPQRSSYAILLACSILMFLLVSPGYASSGPAWQAETPAAPAGGLFQSYVAYSAEGGVDTVGIGDFNHDGLNDVAAVGAGLRIYLQTAQGTLQYSRTYTGGSGGPNMAVGDLNSDGWDDVVVAYAGSDTIGVYLQKADGALEDQCQYATSSVPDAIVVADFNHDGKDDVAVSHSSSGNVGVFYQQVDGSLSALAAYSAPAAGFDDIDAGDVNHDGLTDVVKMNGQGYANPSLSVLYQKPTGGFDGPISYDVGGVDLSNGVAVGDITGDGRDDVAVSSGGNRPYSRLSVFTQDETGSLALSAHYDDYDSPEATAIADVNMDGLLDVLTLHGGSVHLSVLLQQDSGSLAPYQLYSLPYASFYMPQGLDLGDINNDGSPDAVIADYNHGVVVLYNTAVPDFELLVNPPILATVLQGSVAQWQIKIRRFKDFSNPVYLFIQDMPDGSIYTFTENPKTPPGTIDLYVMTPAATPAGLYNLTITGQSGDLQHTAVVQLKVHEAVTGVLAVNSSPSEFGVPVVLTATIETGTEVSYLWNFGDGASATGAIVTHTYNAAGQYTASVKVYNALSSQTVTTSVVVLDKPVSGLFIYYQPPSYANLLTHLFGLIQQGTNVVFSWDFGDGTQGNGAIVDHRFAWPGVYTIRLTAHNSISQVTDELEITVDPPYFVMFPTLFQSVP